MKKVTGEQVISKIRGKKLRNKSELASEGEKPEDLESKTCTICLEEFEIGCYYKRLACSHIYHSEVLDLSPNFSPRRIYFQTSFLVLQFFDFQTLISD